MLRGLTRAGIGDVGDDKRLIELAGKYGFQAVDTDPASLIRIYGREASRELLDAHGVTIGSFGLPAEWRNSEEEFRGGLAALASQAEAAASLGCSACCTYILPSTDRSPAAFAIQAVRRLRLCADILGAFGIRFGLEFVGPHHWRTAFKHPFIYKMEETLELIAAIGLPNVGLLLDSYHWYTCNLTTADIDKLTADQIAYVHLNDAKPLPVEQLLDNDRLYPGEGVIDLQGFLGSLRKIGYRGVVAQEVILPPSESESVEEKLIRSKTGFDALFAM